MRLTGTLKSGEILTVEYSDRETAEAELRCIERWRQHRVGLPVIYWRTVDGAQHCLRVSDFASGPALVEPEPAVAS